MYIRLILTLLLPASFLAACAGAIPEREDTTAKQGTPELRIVFEKTEYDFGTIKQSGGVVQHDFPFVYEGNVPLSVTGTPTSCTCTNASINRTILAPGESGVLTVIFNPNLHAEPLGRFFKTALILTDPPLAGTPEVTIFAKIDLDLGPQAYELKEHYDDEKHEELSGTAQAGHIEAKAIVVSNANITALKETSGDTWPERIPTPEKTAVFLSLDNHQEDLSIYDYGSLASLDGDKAEGWTPLGSSMGGHHISGILTFLKMHETPKEIRISGLSVGEVVISLTERTPRG